MVLLCERERAMLLKKEFFLVADGGGELVNFFFLGKFSIFGDELMVFEFCFVRKLNGNN